jgi:uncharacterized membrane protein
MQFGKVHGIALLVLGFLLILVQGVISMSPRQDASTPARNMTQNVEGKISFAPGIFGALLVFGGIWIVYSAKRRDEPPPERAVK